MLRILACTVAVASLVAGEALAYEIVNSGIAGRGEIFWLDNDRVLLAGYGEQQGKAYLYVWDSSKRKASIHSEIPATDYVCFSDGLISYAVQRDGKRYIREGILGKETERIWSPRLPGSKVDRNEFTCKDFDYSNVDKLVAGFNFFPLRDGDGYWGARSSESTAHAPMYYLQSKATKPISLPVPIRERRRVSYSEYLRAYVIERSELSRKDSEQLRGGKAWILHPGGKTASIDIPAGPWLNATWGYAPTKKGLALASRALGRKSSRDVGDAGLYLVDEGKVERLVAGFPSLPAVSLDGCKIAIILDSLHEQTVRPALQIVSLCR